MSAALRTFPLVPPPDAAPPHRASPRVVIVFPDAATTMIRACGRLDGEDVGCIESLMTSEDTWRRGPQRLLMDFGAVTGADPRHFDHVFEVYASNRARLDVVIERSAMVRPSGLFGAAAHGFATLLQVQAPWAVVTSADEAAQCLGAELESLLLALPQAARAAWQSLARTDEPSMVECIRSFLWENLATASIESAARAVGTSKRSLQRSLKESGTSFRELVWETRLERTKQLLAETDLKLLAVSLSIGLQKPQQLRQFFLERVGKTPREFRRAARIAALLASQTRERDAERSTPSVSGFFPSPS